MSYKDIKDRIKNSANKENGSKRYSREDHIALMQGALNEPDMEVTIYSNPSGKTPDQVTRQPMKDYRTALKGVAKQLGIDKAEADKIDDLELTKQHAAAIIEVSEFVGNELLDTGKKYRLPLYNTSDTVVTLSKGRVGEEVKETKKIVETEPGKYEQVPTGKTVKTAPHSVTKVSNKVPAWMKEDV